MEKVDKRGIVIEMNLPNTAALAQWNRKLANKIPL
jgi:hypothetical protein